MTVSFQLDDFILEKDTTYWKAELSDGTFVYQDDFRPNLQPESAWLRLKSYCEQQNIFPVKMWITFRSHTEFCGESDTGFFFSLAILGSPGCPNEHMYICGPIKDGMIHAKTWKVPEIIETTSEARPILGNEEKIIKGIA